MIYVKTAEGQLALQTRSLTLLPRQRSAFIMFDGKRSMQEVMKATEGLGVHPDDVAHMVGLGLLAPVEAAAGSALATGAGASAPTASAVSANGATASAPLSAEAALRDARAHYSKAYPIAIRLTSELGLRGFRLNLAVETAGDLDKLRQLGAQIRVAVGPQKFAELERALYD